MFKKLKPFLCLILAVILPLCFVACKSSKKEQNDGGGVNNSSPEPTPEETPTPEISYVLNDAEVNRILSSSFDVCKSFIDDLNESNILKDNEYLEAVGVKTYSIFDYAFYPARFANGYTNEFVTTKTYVYQQGADRKFFDIKTNDSNDKINVTIIIDEYNSDTVTAYFYEFKIDEGDIDSLKISYINTDSSRINFSETLFDFKNFVCEIGLGNVSEFSSNRTFLNNNFTADKFSQIVEDKWSYSYYQKFDFSSEKDYQLNANKMPENDSLIAYFDEFGFLDVFDVLDEYRQISSSDRIDMGSDYFKQYSSFGFMSYDEVNYIFKMSAGGED